MSWINNTVVLLTAAVLGGCVGMENDSSCTKIDGMRGCASITDVNAYVDRGDIYATNDGQVYRSYNQEPGDGDSDNDDVLSKFRLMNNALKVNESPKDSRPVRTSDRVVSMTIFPFKDKDGAYHDTSVIHFVDKHSRWDAPAVRDIIGSEDK